MFYALLSAMSEKVLNSGETYTGGRGHRETLKGTSKNVKFPLAYHTPPKNQGDFAKKCMNLS